MHAIISVYQETGLRCSRIDLNKSLQGGLKN
jgi:hypothetical protein